MGAVWPEPEPRKSDESDRLVGTEVHKEGHDAGPGEGLPVGEGTGVPDPDAPDIQEVRGDGRGDLGPEGRPGRV